MPRFPKKEAEIEALAKQMIAGYQKYPADFPSIVWPMLNVQELFYVSAKENQREKYAKAKLATQNKAAGFALLKETMKNCLRKSEVDVANDPAKLALIGWGSPKLPQSVEKPGQPNNLYSANQGKGSITLKWDGPTEGGGIRNYIIQRRCQQKDSGKFDSWKLIASAFENEIFLTNQPQRNSLEYRVKAVNISGESLPSNIVAAVL